MQERNPGLLAVELEWRDEAVSEYFCMVVAVPCGLMVELVKVDEPALQHRLDEACPDYQQCPEWKPAETRAWLTTSLGPVLSRF